MAEFILDTKYSSLEQQIAELSKNPKDFNSLRDFMRFLRQTRLRQSELAVKYGNTLLENFGSQLDTAEFWDLHEQIFIASLDINNQSVASKLLNAIKQKFGVKSFRVRRLVAMKLEAEGKFREADEEYRKIIEEDPANQQAMKRQIAIRKSLNDLSSCTRLLNEYLKIFAGDVDAWNELGDIYLSQQQYKNAAFCYEEILLASPQNHHYFSRYAEILYTMGGYENFKLARKNFAYSYELNPTVKAVYGILMSAIAVSSTKQGKSEKDNSELLEWAYNKLNETYKATDAKTQLILLKSFQKYLPSKEEK